MIPSSDGNEIGIEPNSDDLLLYESGKELSRLSRGAYMEISHSICPKKPSPGKRVVVVGFEVHGVKCHLWVGGWEDSARSLCGFKLGRPRAVEEVELGSDVECFRGRQICKKCLSSLWQ